MLNYWAPEAASKMGQQWLARKASSGVGDEEEPLPARKEDDAGDQADGDERAEPGRQLEGEVRLLQADLQIHSEDAPDH